jgi:hypothetical protein
MHAMDFAHDGMSFAIPDSVNGDTPDDILNESALVQLQSAANTAEATHSLPANNLDGAALQYSEVASTTSTRASPSQAQNGNEVSPIHRRRPSTSHLFLEQKRSQPLSTYLTVSREAPATLPPWDGKPALIEGFKKDL